MSRKHFSLEHDDVKFAVRLFHTFNCSAEDAADLIGCSVTTFRTLAREANGYYLTAQQMATRLEMLDVLEANNIVGAGEVSEAIQSATSEGIQNSFFEVLQGLSDEHLAAMYQNELYRRARQHIKNSL